MLPLPIAKVGDVNTRGEFQDTSAFLQAFDLEYRRDSAALEGTIDLRAEWVFSNVDKATYDPTGALHFGPVGFRNRRNGGYVQAAYRPSLVTNKILKNFEVVLRYDWLTSPVGAPGGEHEKRWAIGVDYWVLPNAVLKLAYEFDDKKVGDSADALMIQFGIGL